MGKAKKKTAVKSGKPIQRTPIKGKGNPAPKGKAYRPAAVPPPPPRATKRPDADTGAGKAVQPYLDALHGVDSTKRVLAVIEEVKEGFEARIQDVLSAVGDVLAEIRQPSDGKESASVVMPASEPEPDRPGRVSFYISPAVAESLAQILGVEPSIEEFSDMLNALLEDQLGLIRDMNEAAAGVKPVPVPVPAPPAGDAPAKRRGRPPGSKNKATIVASSTGVPAPHLHEYAEEGDEE